MTIHYHGCPITPRLTLHELGGRFFCNSFAEPRDTEVCHRIGQGNMLDNGAFTAWTQGRAPDWQAWATWAERWLEYPTTWAVLPDSIDGGEEENDRLLHWCLKVRTWRSEQLAPVWHLHEPIDRLLRLIVGYGKVCFGSSGQYRVIGSPSWHRRVSEAFDAISLRHDGLMPWVHMLRGMSLAGSQYPFASLDSTDVARNHNRLHNGAKKMAERWDVLQCPARWQPVGVQEELVM